MRKMFYLLTLTLLLLVNCSASFSDSTCSYKDPKGNDYDLSPLKKDTFWKTKDLSGDSGLFSMVYLFNFCKSVSTKCKGQDVGAYEALEVLGQVTDTCEILGRGSALTEVEPLDKNNPDRGLKITYSGGDMCTNHDVPSENSKPRKVHFIVECAEEADNNFGISYKVNPYTQVRGVGEGTKCNLEFRIKSPAGCRAGYLSQRTGHSSLNLLFWLVFILGLYFGGGYYYNYKYQGKSGEEAIPHFQSLKNIPELALEGLRFTFQKSQEFAKTIVERGSRRGNGQGSGYQTV